MEGVEEGPSFDSVLLFVGVEDHSNLSVVIDSFLPMLMLVDHSQVKVDMEPGSDDDYDALILPVALHQEVEKIWES